MYNIEWDIIYMGSAWQLQISWYLFGIRAAILIAFSDEHLVPSIHTSTTMEYRNDTTEENDVSNAFVCVCVCVCVWGGGGGGGGVKLSIYPQKQTFGKFGGGGGGGGGGKLSIYPQKQTFGKFQAAIKIRNSLQGMHVKIQNGRPFCSGLNQLTRRCHPPHWVRSPLAAENEPVFGNIKPPSPQGGTIALGLLVRRINTDSPCQIR